MSKSRVPEAVGLTLEQLSARLGVDVVDAVFELLTKDPEAEVEIRGSVELHRAALEEFVRHRMAAVVTDTFALDLGWEMRVPPYYPPHPNTYGCFPRFLKEYVVKRKLLTLEEAVAKITSVPAERMRLAKRGLIRPGYHADLVVFSLEELDHPPEGDPRRPPVG